MYKAHQYMVDKERFMLFAVDKEQIFVFRYWYQNYSHKKSIFKEFEIIHNIIEA